jgi:uncharacterized protein YjbI with pentapeptide repeats
MGGRRRSSLLAKSEQRGLLVMANEEHLAILRQGVEVWDSWRKKNPEIIPNFSDINFYKADFSNSDFEDASLYGDFRQVDFANANFYGVDFKAADFDKANFSEAIFIECDLYWANFGDPDFRKEYLGLDISPLKRRKVALEDFSKVNLIGGNFREVTFSGSFRRANFRNTNFSQASFRRVDIRESSFFRARFTEVNFEDANLFQTDFSRTNVYELELSNLRLNGVKLCNTDLSEKDINNTYLIEADLSSANLIGADLSDANLEKANLYKANLSNVNLTKVQALGTNFTGAIFTGACIQDWNTNSATNLTDVICDYIYLRQGQKERRPSIDDFAPGEFAKLFQKSLETVDLIFRNGIDWDAFAYSFKKLEVENQGAQLDVQSIEKKGDGILVVRVAVSPDADKAKIHNQFIQGYEFAAKALEAQYQARLEDKNTLISTQEAQINRLFDIVEQQGSVQKALAENPRKVSNYNMQNPQFAGGIVDAINVNTEQVGSNIQNIDNQETPG